MCYSLVAEMSSTRLRPKTVVLARIAYNIFGIVNGIIVPKSESRFLLPRDERSADARHSVLNPEAWDWAALSGFFWCAPRFPGFLSLF